MDHVEEHGTARYEQCCALDLEGTDKASGLVTRGRSLATFLFNQTEVDLSGLPHPTKPHRPPRRSQHPKAKLRFPVHPHMLRHACGYALANKGMDTRSLQAYLGHASITHTVRYTEMSPTRLGDLALIRRLSHSPGLIWGLIWVPYWKGGKLCICEIGNDPICHGRAKQKGAFSIRFVSSASALPQQRNIGQHAADNNGRLCSRVSA